MSTGARGAGQLRGPSFFAVGLALLVVFIQVVLRPAYVGKNLATPIEWALGSAPSLLFVLGAPFLGMDPKAAPGRRAFAFRCLAVVAIALAYEVSQDFRADRSFDRADCVATLLGGPLAYATYHLSRRRRWIESA